MATKKQREVQSVHEGLQEKEKGLGNKSSYPRVKRWRKAHPDKYRVYMRKYMAKRRAEGKA